MKLNDVIELHVKEAYRLEILRTKKYRDAVQAAREAREAYWRENNNPSALVDPWSL